MKHTSPRICISNQKHNDTPHYTATVPTINPRNFNSGQEMQKLFFFFFANILFYYFHNITKKEEIQLINLLTIEQTRQPPTPGPYNISNSWLGIRLVSSLYTRKDKQY